MVDASNDQGAGVTLVSYLLGGVLGLGVAFAFLESEIEIWSWLLSLMMMGGALYLVRRGEQKKKSKVPPLGILSLWVVALVTGLLAYYLYVQKERDAANLVFGVSCVSLVLGFVLRVR